MMVSSACTALGARSGSDLNTPEMAASGFAAVRLFDATTKSAGFKPAHADNAANVAASGHLPRPRRLSVDGLTPISLASNFQFELRAATTSATTSKKALTLKPLTTYASPSLVPRARNDAVTVSPRVPAPTNIPTSACVRKRFATGGLQGSRKLV